MISVLIGASDYPRKPDWSNPVLGLSAQALRDYVLSPAGLALAPGQLLDLFDDEAAPADQLLRIADFLNAAPMARDLLLYYIGHGDFHGDDYLLGVRSTQRGREFVTTIESKKLAKIIRAEFRRKRVYVILDSCFSASAASDWQGDEIAVAVRKMTQPLPAHGTAFLAAASKYDVTSAPRTERCTVFTGAVLAALARGVDRAQPRLSIYELYEEVCDILRSREARDADPEGMPEIHVPSQRAGDVSLLPVFPNAAYSRAKASHAVVPDTATEMLPTKTPRPKLSAVAIEPDHPPSASELADTLPSAPPIFAAGAVTLPAPGGPAARRWMPWAIGGAIGGAIVLLLVLLASTRGTTPPASVPVAPIDPAGNALFAGRLTKIRVTPPPGMDGKQTGEWTKIFDEIEKGHFEGARHKLDEFEDKYGTTDQTRELRPQLDALGPDVHVPEHGTSPNTAPAPSTAPGGQQRRKHHDDD